MRTTRAQMDHAALLVRNGETITNNANESQSEQQLSLEMFYAAERLNAAIEAAQSLLGKPVYLEIHSREGFTRITPILYPAAILPRSAEPNGAKAEMVKTKREGIK